MLMYYLHKLNTDIEIGYILIRTFIIYIYAIFLFRIANKRFNFQTPLDFILIFIIGAVLSRTINGPSTLIQAMAASFLLILLHWLFAYAAFKSHRFGTLVKGYPVLLIKDGKVDWNMLRKNQITESDLNESYRRSLNDNDLNNVKEARLERTGTISFIRK